MDAFLGLYDNGSESEDDWIDDFNGLALNGIKNLPPEPQSGNIEYKLKLVNPTEHRIQHLVTQVHHNISSINVVQLTKMKVLIHSAGLKVNLN